MKGETFAPFCCPGAAAAEATRRDAAARPSESERRSLLAPLAKEGLLRRLRDPFHALRVTAKASDDELCEYDRLWTAYLNPDYSKEARTPMYALPEDVPSTATWRDVLLALDHDDGSNVTKRPLPPPSQRTRKGIFVLDHFGKTYCGTKVAGAFHHSSFTRGHCVKFAGSIAVDRGALKFISPHSGHFIPTQDDYDALVADWAAKGALDGSTVVGTFLKDGK